MLSTSNIKAFGIRSRFHLESQDAHNFHTLIALCLTGSVLYHDFFFFGHRRHNVTDWSSRTVLELFICFVYRVLFFICMCKVCDLIGYSMNLPISRQNLLAWRKKCVFVMVMVHGHTQCWSSACCISDNNILNYSERKNLLNESICGKPTKYILERLWFSIYFFGAQCNLCCCAIVCNLFRDGNCRTFRIKSASLILNKRVKRIWPDYLRKQM